MPKIPINNLNLLFHSIILSQKHWLHTLLSKGKKMNNTLGYGSESTLELKNWNTIFLKVNFKHARYVGLRIAQQKSECHWGNILTTQGLSPNKHVFCS